MEKDYAYSLGPTGLRGNPLTHPFNWRDGNSTHWELAAPQPVKDEEEPSVNGAPARVLTKVLAGMHPQRLRKALEHWDRDRTGFVQTGAVWLLKLLE